MKTEKKMQITEYEMHILDWLWSTFDALASAVPFNDVCGRDDAFHKSFQLTLDEFCLSRKALNKILAPYFVKS